MGVICSPLLESPFKIFQSSRREALKFIVNELELSLWGKLFS